MIQEAARQGPRYRPLLQLLRTAETVWNASRIFFLKWDLTPSQFNILNLLRGSTKGLTQIELSRELITHRSNVTGLVDRLVKRRLVQRQTNPNDRRVWRITLTNSGIELIHEILPDYYRHIEELWGGTPAARATRLAKELEQLTRRAAEIAAHLETEGSRKEEE